MRPFTDGEKARTHAVWVFCFELDEFRSFGDIIVEEISNRSLRTQFCRSENRGQTQLLEEG